MTSTQAEAVDWRAHADKVQDALLAHHRQSRRGRTAVDPARDAQLLASQGLWGPEKVRAILRTHLARVRPPEPPPARPPIVPQVRPIEQDRQALATRGAWGADKVRAIARVTRTEARYVEGGTPLPQLNEQIEAITPQANLGELGVGAGTRWRRHNVTAQ